MRKYIFRLLVLGVSSFLLVGAAYAFMPEPPTHPNEFFPLLSRASGWGWVGSDQLVGGDLMLPVFGRDDKLLFLDAQAKSVFNNSDWLASLGAGLRVVHDEKRILGAYLFVDRTVSPHNNQFWFLSPGVESMGKSWDFRLNGYIPTGSKRVTTGTAFASDLGNTSYVSFNQHNQLDLIVTHFEEVGWGGDVEIGRAVSKVPGLHAYVGGYHFNFNQANAINGVAGRVEYLINSHVALSFRDSYDNNQHNTAEAELRFTFGGINKAPRAIHQPVRERLLDPIPRNMATLGKGVGEPVVSEQEMIPNPFGPVVQRANIWFFDPNARASFADVTSCTIENPCSDASFDQSTIDQINSFSTSEFIPPGVKPSFYFKAGSYSALTGSNPDVLTNDSLYSRTFDYTAAQRGAIFNGGFVVNGTSIFNAITLLNNPNSIQPVAIVLNTGGALTFDDSILGVDNNTLSTNYHTGIQMSDSTLTLNNNSEIHAYNGNASTTSAAGVVATDAVGSTIALDQSEIVVTQLGYSATTPYTSVGISAQPQAGALNTTATITLTDNSAVQVNAPGNFGLFSVSGVYATENTNNVSVTDNSTIISNVPLNYGNTADVRGISLTGNTNNVQISDNSTVEADVDILTGDLYIPTTLQPTGIFLSGDNNTINAVNSSQINANVNTAMYAAGSFAQGIYIDSHDTATNSITLNNSEINVNNQVTNLTSILANPISVSSRGIFIDTANLTGTGTNSISMTNHSQINASAGVSNANITVGVADLTLVEGIDIESSANTSIDNVNNTIVVMASAITAQDQIVTGDSSNDQGGLNAFGINLNTGNNSSNAVTIRNASNVQANTLFTTGFWNILNAAGVNIALGDSSTNTVNVLNASTVGATASLATGGGFSNTLTTTGILAGVGNNTTNTILMGLPINVSDSSNIQSNATIQQGGGDGFNSVVAYGVNAYNTSGTTHATNSLTFQDFSTVNANATIVAGGTGTGSNAAVVEGIFVSGASNTTVLENSNTIATSAASNGSSSTVQATGIESVAPLGPMNVVDNQVDPIANSNITALQNGVNNGQLIDQHS